MQALIESKVCVEHESSEQIDEPLPLHSTAQQTKRKGEEI